MLVTIITEDEFGKSVALILGKQFTVEQITLGQGLERDWDKGEHGLVAVCTDRPYFAAFEKLSDRLRLTNLPLTFSYIKDSSLIVGPLIIAGKSPCYLCFQRRMLCHMGNPIMIERVIRAALDRNWSLKSPGMLPTTPVLAAARMARHALLREDDFGQVTQISLSGFMSRDFRIQKVHGCACLPVARFTDELHRSDLVTVIENIPS